MKFYLCASVLPLAISLSVSTAAAPGARVADSDSPNPPSCGIRTSLSPDGLLVATWTSACPPAFTVGAVSAAWSTDLGSTWQTPSLLGSGDVPMVAASGTGRIDVAWRSASGPVLRRSTDGGLSWSPERVIPLTSPLAEAPLEVSGTGDIAMVGLDMASPNVELRVLTSTDGGESFRATNLPSVKFSSPDRLVTWMGATDLLVCWRGDLTTPYEYDCAASADGGLTFGSETAATTPRSNVGSGALVTRAAGDVVLAFGSSSVVRSSDFGQTWSAETVLDPWFYYTNLAVGAGGQVWAASAQLSERGLLGGGWHSIPGRVAVHHSLDGINWQRANPPEELDGCIDPAPDRDHRIHAAATGEVLIADARLLWRSNDQGVSWSRPETMLPRVEPVHDAYVTELAGARLLALWVHGANTPQALLSSLSEDGGKIWSAPARIDDLTLSLRDRPDYVIDKPVPMLQKFDYPPAHRVAVVATASGPALTLWLASVDGECAELRARRSYDGRSWEPSIRLGSATGLPFGVAEDGAGNLVATWIDNDLVASRSTDGGSNWSAASVIRPFVLYRAAMQASPIVRAGDGSLVVLAEFQDTLEALRTTDGGLTWSTALVGLYGLVPRTPAVLVSAGPRLVASQYWLSICDPFGCGPNPEIFLDFESFDFGVTWRQLNHTVPTTSRLVGDEFGSVYWIEKNRRKIGWIGGRVDDLGPAKDATYERGLVALSPGQVGTFYADWNDPVPGVFYDDCAGLLVSPSPFDRRLCLGATTTFSFSASGTGVRYQWYRDGVPIPGATSSDYTIFSVAPAHSGHYQCVATGDCDTKSSTPALLEVDSGPVVTSSPPSRSIRFGRPTSFRVTATGFAPLAYQWSKNGVPIPAATSPTYRLGAVDFADAGFYVCTITGDGGTASSAPAELIVTRWPRR